jgi:hypothetical protein
MRLLNRREFNGLCVALGSCVAASDASAVEPASGAASSGASRTVKFPTAVVPALGQGSWHLGQGRHPAPKSLGMTLIDTAEAYTDSYDGSGKAAPAPKIAAFPHVACLSILVRITRPALCAGNPIAPRR